MQFRTSALLVLAIGSAEAFSPLGLSSIIQSRSLSGSGVEALRAHGPSGQQKGSAPLGLSMLVGVPKQVLVTGASGRTGFATFKVNFDSSLASRRSTSILSLCVAVEAELGQELRSVSERNMTFLGMLSLVSTRRNGEWIRGCVNVHVIPADPVGEPEGFCDAGASALREGSKDA